TLKNYMWKKVIDKKGFKLGRVINIITNNNQIIALELMKLFKKYIIDVNFIETITKNKIKLSIVPVVTIVGRKVFDCEGRHIGKVVELIKPPQKNEFSELVVKKHIFSKSRIIKKDEIKVNERNIILKTRYE
ncbi:MAG: PRC-barrel domain-containing protein, partial [Candidatus Woesearchaeota archaeon]